MMKENVYKESVLIPNEDCCLEMQRNGCCGSDFDSEGSINMTEFVFCMLATCGWTTLPLCKTTYYQYPSIRYLVNVQDLPCEAREIEVGS